MSSINTNNKAPIANTQPKIADKLNTASTEKAPSAVSTKPKQPTSPAESRESVQARAEAHLDRITGNFVSFSDGNDGWGFN